MPKKTELTQIREPPIIFMLSEVRRVEAPTGTSGPFSFSLLLGNSAVLRRRFEVETQRADGSRQGRANDATACAAFSAQRDSIELLC